MRKILVIGTGGAGKSTFARALGERLGLPVIHLDREYWRAGWVEPPKDEWRQRVEELSARAAWVMDGNYSGTFDVRFDACDTIIFLDLPRAVCLWRVLKRSVMYRRTLRPDMAEGCPERLDFKFIQWIWGYRSTRRPKVLALLERHSRDKRVIHLSTRAEVEQFLENIKGGGAV
ncbi:MAG TPA: DNA topology modulation protein [Pyrinomonadaceae bacterium]|nr:DNA topology modulation protein [Pyrinomonadaceae bacterium]